MRESRDITQDDAVGRSGTYSEASGLRKIERGEQRPRRATIIALLTKGLEERDVAKIDELLILAGYEGLSDDEISELGLSKRSPPPVPPPSVVEVEHLIPLPAPTHAPFISIAIIVLCVVVSVTLAVFEGWFVSLCGVLYASLCAVSVLLESAHEFRGQETIRAAELGGVVTLAAALGAIWTDDRFIARGRQEGLWITLLIFVLAACLQWVLVRPALSGSAVALATFRSHTAQAAHLKNTLYFLLIVVLFWMPPRHCVLMKQVNSSVPTTMACPAPLWLWIVFLVMIGASVPMGSHLLDNLHPSPRQNIYVSLFYTRALLYFLLSAVCLIWYSTNY